MERSRRIEEQRRKPYKPSGCVERLHHERTERERELNGGTPVDLPCFDPEAGRALLRDLGLDACV